MFDFKRLPKTQKKTISKLALVVVLASVLTALNFGYFQLLGIDLRAIAVYEFSWPFYLRSCLLLPVAIELILRLSLVPSRTKILVSSLSILFFAMFYKELHGVNVSVYLFFFRLLIFIGIAVGLVFLFRKLDEIKIKSFISNQINLLTYGGIILNMIYDIRLLIERDLIAYPFFAGFLVLSFLMAYAITYVRITHGFFWGLVLSLILSLHRLTYIDEGKLIELIY